MKRSHQVVIVALVLVLVVNVAFWVAFEAHAGLARQHALETQKVELCKLARGDEDRCR